MPLPRPGRPGAPPVGRALTEADMLVTDEVHIFITRNLPLANLFGLTKKTLKTQHDLSRYRDSAR